MLLVECSFMLRLTLNIVQRRPLLLSSPELIPRFVAVNERGVADADGTRTELVSNYRFDSGEPRVLPVNVGGKKSEMRAQVVKQ